MMAGTNPPLAEWGPFRRWCGAWSLTGPDRFGSRWITILCDDEVRKRWNVPTAATVVWFVAYRHKPGGDSYRMHFQSANRYVGNTLVHADVADKLEAALRKDEGDYEIYPSGYVWVECHYE